MKKMFPYIVIVIAAIIIFDKFDQPSGTAHQPNAGEPSAALTATEAYALRAADYGWPQLSDQQTVASSLLAKNYYLVMDGSGSMLESECSQGSTKMAVAKTAMQTFIQQLPADSNIGLYAFDKRGIGERVSLGQQNREEILRALAQLAPGGGTPLSMSVNEGQRALTEQARSQLGYGEYHLVIITDGLASSGYSPEQDISAIIAQTPINIHTIGFCIDDYHSLNQPGLTFYRSANDPDSLQQGLEAVLAESADFTLTEFDQ